MDPHLRITTPAGKPYTRPLDGDRLTIGRAAGCEVVLADKRVSSRHAEIYLADGELRLRDLASTNGTYVNGIRRADAVLRSGDHIRIGNSLVEVVLPGGGGPVPRLAETNRTVIDPFSIKLSLDEVENDLAEPRTTAGGAPGIEELGQKRLLLLYRLGREVNQVGDMRTWLESVARLVREALGPERIAVLSVERRRGSPPVVKPLIARDWTQPEPDRPVYVSPAFVQQVGSPGTELEFAL